MYDTLEAIVPRQASSQFAPRDETTLAMEIAWRVLEEIDYGLILVSPAGTFQHANHLARVELSRSGFLRIDGVRLASHSPDQTEEILRGVHSAAMGRRQMLTLRNGAETLAMACIPLSHPFEQEAASVLLMLARQIGTQNLAVSFFSRSHKLTPAEESVLKALCDGLDVHEIATANGVSECTIRTQVRSLRDKTGISSMRLLVQRVAALPPVVPMSLAIQPRVTARQSF